MFCLERRERGSLRLRKQHTARIHYWSLFRFALQIIELSLTYSNAFFCLFHLADVWGEKQRRFKESKTTSEMFSTFKFMTSVNMLKMQATSKYDL